MNQKSIARILVITGLTMLTLNFISYMMGRPFIAIAALPVGIALPVTRAVLFKKAEKKV